MKREPVNDEHEQNGWLRKTLRQSPAGAGDAHLDPETLAAWVDGGLSAKAAAAVELHASTCPRCTAVLAAMARTAPAVTASDGWTRARLVRWFVPLTAAATAVAIWIAVPHRPAAPVEDLKTASEGARVAVPDRVPVPVPVPVPEAAPVPGPAPGQAAPSAEAQEQFQLRDELRRENAVKEEVAAEPAPAPRQELPFAPEPASPPAAAPSARTAAPASAADASARADSPNVANDALESARSLGQRSALGKSGFSTDSMSPANPQIRWRLVGSARIERSTDGAKTWTPTNVPAASLAAIRAVDGSRAVARTSDNTEFYTADGGRSWTRVQENSQAPF
jgi:hypothetical protein